MNDDWVHDMKQTVGLDKSWFHTYLAKSQATDAEAVFSNKKLDNPDYI